MSTMPQPLSHDPTHHHLLSRAALVVAFWAIAAALVLGAHAVFASRSLFAGAVATICAIALSAFGYMRVASTDRGATHAFAVGITWLLLSIAAEIAVSFRLGDTWFLLLGSPEHPFVRNACLFAWIFAPMLFAQTDDWETHDVDS